MSNLASTSFPLFFADAIFLNFWSRSRIVLRSTELEGLFCLSFSVGFFLDVSIDDRLLDISTAGFFRETSIVSRVFVISTVGCFLDKLTVDRLLDIEMTGCDKSFEVRLRAMVLWYLFSRSSKDSLFRFDRTIGFISMHSFLADRLPGLIFRLPSILLISRGLSVDGSRILSFSEGGGTVILGVSDIIADATTMLELGFSTGVVGVLLKEGVRDNLLEDFLTAGFLGGNLNLVLG